MKQSQIQLVKPCQQDWNAMPQVGGRLYCKDCRKVVTDFTWMSDQELIRTLSKKNSSELCGKFTSQQLEKIYEAPLKKQIGIRPGLKLILTGLLTLRLSSEAQNMGQIKSALNTEHKKPVSKKTEALKILTGKIFDRETKQGIPVYINLYTDKSSPEITKIVASDSLGRYEIELPEEGLHKFFKLIYRSQNYEERTVIVDRDNIPAYLPVSLLPAIAVYVDVVAPPSEILGGVAMMIERRKGDDEYANIGPPEPRMETSLPLRKHVASRIRYFLRKAFRRPD